MPSDESNEAPGPKKGVWFTTTHWSVVLAAKQSEGALAEAALEKLCRTYWAPLYAYIRREGYSAEDAQDLTQEFLSRLVHKEWLNHLHDRRGKFRSFVLTFLKHFLSDERDRTRAQKRGGRVTVIPLDAYQTEERGTLEHATGLSADQLYDQRWARAVMDEAVRRLREDYARRNKSNLYEAIKDLQPGEHGEKNYAEVGAALGLSEQAVKNAVHRFRRRYAELLRDEIAQTVSHPDQVETEVQHLLQVFAR